MVETKWQALIALHKTLLHSPALHRLASRYSMPASMWKHGIHFFLELLRRHLPESIDYMLAFIYLAYQMTTLLYETVPAFEDTWIEYLGHIGRYRMAIEDEDIKDRETWAGVARSWYSKAADRNPSVGRLYHHLAILARPNPLQQLYYYARSLTCVKPFPSARKSLGYTGNRPLTIGLDQETVVCKGAEHKTYSMLDPPRLLHTFPLLGLNDLTETEIANVEKAYNFALGPHIMSDSKAKFSPNDTFVVGETSAGNYATFILCKDLDDYTLALCWTPRKPSDPLQPIIVLSYQQGPGALRTTNPAVVGQWHEDFKRDSPCNNLSAVALALFAEVKFTLAEASDKSAEALLRDISKTFPLV